MENSSETSTPKNKVRSLGLRRSVKKNNEPLTPLSDVKVNYKSLQNYDPSASPSTPCLTQKLPLRASAYTTNCLPYRLSLSRRVRDKYKKKKLEFVTSIHEPEVDMFHYDTNTHQKSNEEPFADLAQDVINKEKLLKSHQKHREKVQELTSVINIWREAFKASLEQLSSKIEPQMETEDLIARIGIPPEMIEYA